MKLKTAFFLFMAALSSLYAEEPEKISGEEKGFHAPLFSPDGRTVIATRGKFSEIWIMDAEHRKPRLLLKQEKCGLGYLWIGRYALLFRGSRGAKSGEYAFFSLDIRNQKKEQLTEYSKKTKPPLLFRDKGGLQLHDTGTGIKRFFPVSPELENTYPEAPVTISGPLVSLKDRHITVPLNNGEFLYNPIVGPDGQKGIVQTSGGNIILADFLSGTRELLAKGEWPCFSPDGKNLAFCKTVEDGQRYTKSDLTLYSFGEKRTYPLLSRNGFLPAEPSFSPMGDSLVFIDLAQGGVYLLHIK